MTVRFLLKFSAWLKSLIPFLEHVADPEGICHHRFGVTIWARTNVAKKLHPYGNVASRIHLQLFHHRSLLGRPLLRKTRHPNAPVISPSRLHPSRTSVIPQAAALVTLNCWKIATDLLAPRISRSQSKYSSLRQWLEAKWRGRGEGIIIIFNEGILN
jgi:hypothetical protein